MTDEMHNFRVIQNEPGMVMGLPVMTVERTADWVELKATAMRMPCSPADIALLEAVFPLPEPEGEPRVRIPNTTRVRLVKDGDSCEVIVSKGRLLELIEQLGGEARAQDLTFKYLLAGGYNELYWQDDLMDNRCFSIRRSPVEKSPLAGLGNSS